MGKYNLDPKWISSREIKGRKRQIFASEGLDAFSPQILQLGDLSQPSEQHDVLCAFIDLSGFTNFCKQIDPYLVIPDFLNSFLNFLFDEIKSETIERKIEDGAILWHHLPFFAKFMGDGLMVLWNTEGIHRSGVANIFISMRNICHDYSTNFFGKSKTEYG